MRDPRNLGLRTGIWLATGYMGLLPEIAVAAGFQVRAGSPDWTANAFAGMAAKGYDASTAWSNPAAMTLLPDSELAGGLNAILPSARFSGENLVGPFPTPGQTGGNDATAAATASLAGVWSASQDLKFGFSLESPFGQRLSYPFNFVGRYQSLVSAVTDIELGMVAAYRINEHLSIGGGPIVDYFQPRLTTAINTGPTAALTGDPIADIHAHDWSAGYHLGTLYEFDSGLRTGIDYRSRIRDQLEGEQGVSFSPLLATLNPPLAAQLAAASTDVHTSVTLPDVLTVSAVWDVSPEWSGLATVQWTDWSLLQQVSIIGANGQTTTLPLQLRNTWLGSVGANYRPGSIQGLMLQAGLGFDESAVTDSTRSPRLPARSNIILGLGFTYEILPNASLQAAFLHEFGVGPNGISYSGSPSAGVLIGSYDTSVTVISLGLNWRF
jgi:long-chain fatty acid transport protein